MGVKLNSNYSTLAFARSINTNMAVDGSVTPREFFIRPEFGYWDVEWDITRIICKITDGSSMDTGKFGGITSLTKGFNLRKKNGEFTNLWNVRNNGEFEDVAFDVSYSDKAPAGQFSFSMRKTWAGQSKSGVTVRLDPNQNEELEGLVQDDLTGLNDFHCRPSGSLTN